MTLNGRVIGQAERATRTLLDVRLQGSGLAFEEWVALNQVEAGAGAYPDVVARLAGGLKVDDATARDAVDSVRRLGLADEADTGDLALTAAGRERFDAVIGEIETITARLYGDVPAEDLEVAGRVLTLLTERANAELARQAVPSV